ALGEEGQAGGELSERRRQADRAVAWHRRLAVQQDVERRPLARQLIGRAQHPRLLLRRRGVEAHVDLVALRQEGRDELRLAALGRERGRARDVAKQRAVIGRRVLARI